MITGFSGFFVGRSVRTITRGSLSQSVDMEKGSIRRPDVMSYLKKKTVEVRREESNLCFLQSRWYTGDIAVIIFMDMMPPPG